MAFSCFCGKPAKSVSVPWGTIQKSRRIANEIHNQSLAQLLRILTVMQRINRHILTLGRLFLIIFFLANSGFTVLLRHCTMAMMDCCGGNDNCTGSSCENEHAAPAPKAATMTLGTGCQVSTFAGGYQTDPSIMGKDSTPRLVKIDILPVVTIDIASQPVNTQALSAFSSAGRIPFPPPVETYVLNAALLI